jgi:hypothetical protein
MIAEAADMADEIVAEQEALHRRRGDLEALTRLLTNEGRKLNRMPPSLPPVISRALYPADRNLADPATDWAALCEDKEA